MVGRITRMAGYYAVCLVYCPYCLEFPLVSIPFQRQIYSAENHIGNNQSCPACRHAVLYSEFGIGFGKGFCFSEFGRSKIRQNASPCIDCVGICLDEPAYGTSFNPFDKQTQKEQRTSTGRSNPCRFVGGIRCYSVYRQSLLRGTVLPHRV